MGKTAEAQAEEHGTVEVVVLHGAVSYRDPEDVATDPREYTYRTASRGDKITVDKAAAERLFGLGSVAKPDSDDAGFAEAGMRDPSVLGTPPSAAMIAPESSQVGAIKAVVADRVGDPAALMKLDEHQLKQVAVAFGIPVKDGMTHAELASAIAGDSPEIGGAGTMQQSDLAPGDAQVTGKGASSTTSTSRKGGRKSGGSQSDSGGSDESGGEVQATNSAQTLAAENDVDLADVQGTGSGGQVTQPDVAKYLADRQSSGD